MKILILCNGSPPPRPLLASQVQWCELFIAADGGANIALDMDFEPDAVVGDLDSFDNGASGSLEVIKIEDQETNDLEKALNLAKERGGREVRVLGATGLRLDHTLKNLSVLKQFDEQFEQLLFKDRFGEAYLIPREFEGAYPVGTTLSLIPLSGKVQGIKTRGLKYPLNDEDLEVGIRDGHANRVESSPFSIEYVDGDLALFIEDHSTR
ncbi:MAG: thiamine diphosphokinase [Balneolaceae bacterium]|nr:thiamine diphosphokinase [Balneolaceae bacterium]